MKKRWLGQGVEVSSIGLGYMTMGNKRCKGTKEKDEEMIKIIHQAYKEGVKFFDTAEVYAKEELVSKAIKPFRKDIVLATKCGVFGLDEQQIANANPSEIRKSSEDSLKNYKLVILIYITYTVLTLVVLSCCWNDETI